MPSPFRSLSSFRSFLALCSSELIVLVLVLVLVVDVVGGSDGICRAMAGQGEALMAGG